jgi:tetratricopeptide (TPR) repeat protein
MSLKTERDLNPTGRNQLARAKTAAQSKNFDYAITLLQALLKDEPLFLDGRRLLRAVEIQKSETKTKFFGIDLKGMGLSGKLGGMVKGAKKAPQDMLIQAEEVLAGNPYDRGANDMIAEAGMTMGYPEFKCFAYETLKKGKPEDKVILNTLAVAYMDAKNFPKAVSTYEEILGLFPTDGDALSGMKNAQAANAAVKGNWEAAEKEGDFRMSLKSKEESDQLEQDSKEVKSVDAIDEAIQRNYEKQQAEPTNPNHPKEIAKLYEKKNDYASACQWYEYAFEVGGRIDSSLEKTVGDLKLKQVEQGMQELVARMAEETDPEQQAQLQTALAEKENELNDVRLFQAEARVRAQPNEGEFRFDLGEALYKIGQYKRATEELQLSLKQPSVRYQALNMMGLAFMKRNMMDFAIKQLTLAQSELAVMDEIKKEITYNLGLAYEVAKNAEKALEQWKMIYEYDMSYRDVAARVEASYGQGEGA